jgi:hypothetical protein
MRSDFPKIFLQFSCIFLTLPLGAQALRVSALPGVAARDGAVTLEIASPPGKEPAALQWDFSVPDALLIDAQSATAGKAAKSAGKAIQCRMQFNLQGERTSFCRCLLIGGVNRIPNGPVAILKYSARPEAKAGKYGIDIVRAFAVSADAKKTPLHDATAGIEILK